MTSRHALLIVAHGHSNRNCSLPRVTIISNIQASISTRTPLRASAWAWYLVPGLLIFMSLPAFTATVDSVKGKVVINRGDGFQQVTTGAQANAGDQLMAGPGGSAKLVYSDRCQVSVVPGRVVSVGKQPPCTAPSLVGEDFREGFFGNPVPPFVRIVVITRAGDDASRDRLAPRRRASLRISKDLPASRVFR